MNTPVLSATTAVIGVSVTELNQANARVAELTKQVTEQRTAFLKSLPTEIGFATADEFIVAFNEAHGIETKRKGRKSTSGSSERKPRVNLNDSQRANIVKFFKEGGKVAEAVTKFDISQATAQNIKKEAGMVNERS